MNNQAVVIADLLRSGLKGRRARMGIAFSSGADVLERLLFAPHDTVVFGERFHPLFRAGQACARDAGGRLREDVIFLETRFCDLPIRQESLDALVLLGGLPRCEANPLLTLIRLRGLLQPGGLLIWPQPICEGFFGRIARMRHKAKNGSIGASERTLLCRLTMEAGFMEIGQTPIPKKTIPWTITVARAGSRPWVPSAPFRDTR